MIAQVDLSTTQHGGAGVEPGDLQQVGEQRLEAVELVLQQLGGAGGDGSKSSRASYSTSAAIRTVVSGRPQLVGDVGDETLLDRRQLLERGDLLLQLGGHVVHRRGEPGQVVLAAHLHPVVEVARGEALGGPPGGADRGHDLAADQGGDEGQQDDQDRAGGDHRVAQHPSVCDLLGEREDQVDLRSGRCPAGSRSEPAAARRPTAARRGSRPRSGSSAGRRSASTCWRSSVGMLVAAASPAVIVWPRARMITSYWSLPPDRLAKPVARSSSSLSTFDLAGQVGGVQLLLAALTACRASFFARLALALHHPERWPAASAGTRRAPGPAPRRRNTVRTHPQRQGAPPPAEREPPPPGPRTAAGLETVPTSSAAATANSADAPQAWTVSPAL